MIALRVAIAGLALSLAAAAAPCLNGGPAVTTDKSDYGPSETVAIAGCGASFRERLTVRITAPGWHQAKRLRPGSSRRPRRVRVELFASCNAHRRQLHRRRSEFARRHRGQHAISTEPRSVRDRAPSPIAAASSAGASAATASSATAATRTARFRSTSRDSPMVSRRSAWACITCAP